MASSGSAAWRKYFQGRGDISTTLKKDSIIYDNETGNKKIDNLKAGEKIIYLSSKQYESKASISYGKNKFGKVTFNNITKPGVKASGAISLKPQSFGVASETKKWSYNDYVKIILENIEERKDLTPEIKSYLSALVNYYLSKTSINEVKNIYNKVKNDIPINDINKDFGEVLGPIGVIENGLLSKKGFKVDKLAKIYVPIRPNEPLMDYGLIQNKTTYTISAKSGKTTNTVKPKDIIDLLQSGANKSKWINTKEYALLKKIADNDILTGSIKAVSTIYPDLINPKIADNLTKDNFNQNAFTYFISQNDYLKNQSNPTLNQIMYECEKMIQSETKNGKINLSDIFIDAIKNKVIYIKFEVGNNGVGNWEVIISDDIKAQNKRPFLRTKNGYKRAADRMGIQL